MFLSATKTLGVDTTAILVSDVAPSRSCLAKKAAVSSEYYVVTQVSNIRSLNSHTPGTGMLPGQCKGEMSSRPAYPELRLVPVLAKHLHRQRVDQRGLPLAAVRLALLGRGLELLELPRAGVPARVELLQGVEGVRRQGSANTGKARLLVIQIKFIGPVRPRRSSMRGLLRVFSCHSHGLIVAVCHLSASIEAMKFGQFRPCGAASTSELRLWLVSLG